MIKKVKLIFLYVFIILASSCQVYTQHKNTYFDTGELKTKVTYRNGKLHGKYMSFYKNGNIEEVKYYKNGIVDGPFYIYYENSQLCKQGYYNLGKVDSILIGYSLNGDTSFVYKNRNDSIIVKMLYKEGILRRKADYDHNTYILYDEEREPTLIKPIN
ncbi:MAG: hypothetical protein K9H64_23525 [Bacteroidales bacterium]|nr:hypothetical protein [Bacteroidales bacterium]MCF8459007.1 hypothetical protein [Bacteroidales bacterium]